MEVTTITVFKIMKTQLLLWHEKSWPLRVSPNTPTWATLSLQSCRNSGTKLRHAMSWWFFLRPRNVPVDAYKKSNRNVELRVKNVGFHKFENATWTFGWQFPYSTIPALHCFIKFSKVLLLKVVGWGHERVSSARMSPAPWFLPSDYLAVEEIAVKIPSKLACSVYKCWSQYLDTFKTCHQVEEKWGKFGIIPGLHRQ